MAVVRGCVRCSLNECCPSKIDVRLLCVYVKQVFRECESRLQDLDKFACCLHGCWYAVPGPYVRGEETTLTDDIQHRLPSAAAECSIQPIRNDDFERPTWLKSFRHKLCV